MSLEAIKTEWDELSNEFSNLEVSEIEIKHWIREKKRNRYRNRNDRTIKIEFQMKLLMKWRNFA